MGIAGPELFYVFSLSMIREMALTVAEGRVVLPVGIHPRNRGLKKVGGI